MNDAERTRQIQRQHSQEMAIRTAQLIFSFTGFALPSAEGKTQKDKKENVKEMLVLITYLTNHFEKDIERKEVKADEN